MVHTNPIMWKLLNYLFLFPVCSFFFFQIFSSNLIIKILIVFLRFFILCHFPCIYILSSLICKCNGEVRPKVLSSVFSIYSLFRQNQPNSLLMMLECCYQLNLILGTQCPLYCLFIPYKGIKCSLYASSSTCFS